MVGTADVKQIVLFVLSAQKGWIVCSRMEIDRKHIFQKANLSFFSPGESCCHLTSLPSISEPGADKPWPLG